MPLMDYAQATLPHESTGLAPIQVEMGYLPRTSFDWSPLPPPLTDIKGIAREEADLWMGQIHEAWQVARDAIAEAQ